VDQDFAENPSLMKGLNIYNGILTREPVAKAFELQQVYWPGPVRYWNLT
jgi:alanine dehydrogenase